MNEISIEDLTAQFDGFSDVSSIKESQAAKAFRQELKRLDRLKLPHLLSVMQDYWVENGPSEMSSQEAIVRARKQFAEFAWRADYGGAGRGEFMPAQGPDTAYRESESMGSAMRYVVSLFKVSGISIDDVYKPISSTTHSR